MSTPTPVSEQFLFDAMYREWLDEPPADNASDTVMHLCARVAAQLLNDVISRAAEDKAAHERALVLAYERGDIIDRADAKDEVAAGADGEGVEGDGGCVDVTKVTKVTKAEPTLSLAELQREVARLHRALRVSLRGGRHFATVAAILNGEE